MDASEYILHCRDERIEYATRCYEDSRYEDACGDKVTVGGETSEQRRWRHECERKMQDGFDPL